MAPIALTTPIREMLDIHNQNNVRSLTNRTVTTLVIFVFQATCSGQSVQRFPVRPNSQVGAIYE